MKCQSLVSEENKKNITILSSADCASACIILKNISDQILQENPFRDRIVKVFSSSNDGQMTFEDFLDMMSVFSDNAPKSVKVEYAFRIYGKGNF